MAKNQPGSYLVRLRPRPVHLQVSRGRTVLVTNREGLIQGGRVKVSLSIKPGCSRVGSIASIKSSRLL